MRVTLGGAEVDLLHRDEVLSEVLHHLETDGPSLALTFVDLEHLHHFGVDAGRSGLFDLRGGDAEWRVLVASGAAIRQARRLTRVWWERQSVDDLLPDVLLTVGRARKRVGVVGGSNEHHRALATAIADRYPNVEYAGGWAPHRDEVDDLGASSALAAEIAAADVDLLLVALGKPRQELWLRRHLAELDVPVAVAVGDADDLLEALGSAVPAAASSSVRTVSHEPLAPLLRAIRVPGNLLRLRTQTPELPARSGRGPSRSPQLVASPARMRRRLTRAFALADLVGLTLATLGAYLIRDALGGVAGLEELRTEIPTALGVLPLWLILLHVLGAYRPDHLSTGGAAWRRYVLGSIGGVVAVGFVSFVFGLQVSRLYVLALFVLAVAWGTATRLFARERLRRQREAGRLVQNVLVVGVDHDSVDVADAMVREGTGRYRVVGFVDDEQPVGTVVHRDLEVLGSTDDVLDIAYDQRAGLVLVSPAGVRPGLLRDLTVALEGSPVDLAVAPSLFQVVSRRMTVESVGTVPILHVDQIRLDGSRALVKRTLDLVGSTLLLLVLSPVILGAAVAVRLGSPGPVFFRQERVGKDGVPFTMLKFRTMVVDAESRLDDVADLNEAGHHFFKVRKDPRVTRVGRVLRKWSVDETPQFLNVLKGEMSLVGPRPPLPREVEKYEPWHLRRLRVRPGVTGVWQVSGRSEVPFDEAVRMDLFYIENWSLAWDVGLLLKTVRAVLGRQGAY